MSTNLIIVFTELAPLPPQVMQHITYNEWLPIILGPRVLDIFELNLLPRGHYQVQLCNTVRPHSTGGYQSDGSDEKFSGV